MLSMTLVDFAALERVEPRFRGIPRDAIDIEVWGGGYGGVVRLILGQLVSIEAADAMWRNLNDAIGTVTPASIRAADKDTLRACGFTRRKAEYARAIGDAVDSGLDFGQLDRKSDDEIVRRLLELPGVGRWTAECYLLFCLGRPDVFPAGDLALRIGWQELSGAADTPSEGELRAIAREWSPHRTAASYLIWTSYLIRRDRL
jgi:DNA-3-methyladenine glycosylase II